VYKAALSKQAAKDLEKLKRAGLARKAKEFTEIVEVNPYQNPPPYEKLIGDLRGYISRRINEQHRYTYQVLPNDKDLKDEHGELYEGIVKILRMWTHYE
jgi:Txe/YoeB family toxin of toxin-antitoxin system